MNRQTAIPKEWIIVHENKAALKKEMAGVYVDGKVTVIQAPKTGNPSNLNASTNIGLRSITTPYVIFYQDFIDLPKNCFRKLMDLANPYFFITTCTPNYDGTNDIRYTGSDDIHPCPPNHWEINVGMAPMAALRAIGGFEEALDQGWAYDNSLVAAKADMLGYSFIIDEMNRPKLLPHELTSKLELELNDKRCYRILQEIEQGVRPIKAKYLE